MKLWQRGATRHTTKGKTKPKIGDHGLIQKHHCVSADGNNFVNPDIIGVPQIGLERAKKYFETYYFQGELHQLVRSNRDVTLKSVPILLESKQEVEENWNPRESQRQTAQSAKFPPTMAKCRRKLSKIFTSNGTWT